MEIIGQLVACIFIVFGLLYLLIHLISSISESSWQKMANDDEEVKDYRPLIKELKVGDLTQVRGYELGYEDFELKFERYRFLINSIETVFVPKMFKVTGHIVDQNNKTIIDSKELYFGLNDRLTRIVRKENK